jgi:hypothetical protein
VTTRGEAVSGLGMAKGNSRHLPLFRVYGAGWGAARLKAGGRDIGHNGISPLSLTLGHLNLIASPGDLAAALRALILYT